MVSAATGHLLCACALGVSSCLQHLPGHGTVSACFQSSLGLKLLPEKCGKGMKHGLEMLWAGGSELPTHRQKWCPLESSSPSSQDSVASNSVRKAYSVVEGGLFRDPCSGCSRSLSSFPCKSGIPSFLQHEGRGELVAQNTCL